LPVPVDDREAKGHDEIAKRYQVQIEGGEVMYHDEIVPVTSKKRGTRASADSANDTVPGDETVRVPKYFINGTEFRSIDFGTGYKFVMGWRKAID
jgi:hypothetical protein